MPFSTSRGFVGAFRDHLKKLKALCDSQWLLRLRPTPFLCRAWTFRRCRVWSQHLRYQKYSGPHVGRHNTYVALHLRDIASSRRKPHRSLQLTLHFPDVELSVRRQEGTPETSSKQTDSTRAKFQPLLTHHKNKILIPPPPLRHLPTIPHPPKLRRLRNSRITPPQRPPIARLRGWSEISFRKSLHTIIGNHISASAGSSRRCSIFAFKSEKSRSTST